jgi:serine/threonine protein kinase
VSPRLIQELVKARNALRSRSWIPYPDGPTVNSANISNVRCRRKPIGPYEILAPIGAGGMGEVYRARDTKPDRKEAIKVLPDAVARDPERLARFEREAKILAALNHPNIAHIYGVEDDALVMELGEGANVLSKQLLRVRPLDSSLAWGPSSFAPVKS